MTTEVKFGGNQEIKDSLKKQIELIMRILLLLGVRNFVKHLVIHHEAGNSGLDKIDQMYKAYGYTPSSLGHYAPYTWYMDIYGNKVRLRKDWEAGAHTKNWNNQALAICVAGNYEHETPNSILLENLKDWLQDNRKKYNLPMKEVYGHKEVPGNQTLCPGKNLMTWIIKYRNDT